MKVVIRRRSTIRPWMKENYIYLLGLLALLATLIVVAVVVLHFQFGIDLWWVGVRNFETAQYWGQLGDFVGGILNPLLSFCALVAVLYNLSLQREELALARKDARDAQEIQQKQSAIFERQNFESVFFQLLDVHSRLSSNMSIKLPASASRETGQDAFDVLARKYLGRKMLEPSRIVPLEEQVKTVENTAKDFLDNHAPSVGHYYRNIYQILKYIDGLGNSSAVSSRKSSMGMEIRRTLRLYRSQRDYANILRAQLSSSEVACLFLNCLSEPGVGLKYYVEKYSMLKTLDFGVIGNNEAIKNLFGKLAYADFEEMDMNDVLAHVKSRHRDTNEQLTVPSPE
ncbi:putative phage abortive infection protein [Pseudomonas shirazica]|uniref:putative phage abortive infection protein n=1 Tax=Pseudomonas TaxID=286 RepID=UPI003851ECAF